MRPQIEARRVVARVPIHIDDFHQRLETAAALSFAFRLAGDHALKTGVEADLSWTDLFRGVPGGLQRGQFVEFLDVRPGHEGLLPRAGQDDHADRVVGSGLAFRIYIAN